MNDNLIAKAETFINASREEVWKALTTPEGIKAYMFGADVKTDWTIGSPITWSGEFKGKPYEDKGEILAFDPGNTLSYSHYSPMSGKPDTPDNYHKVRVTLSGVDESTTNVRLEQDNNETEEARTESEKTWKTILDGLKKYVEGTAASTAKGGAS